MDIPRLVLVQGVNAGYGIDRLLDVGCVAHQQMVAYC